MFKEFLITAIVIGLVLALGSRALGQEPQSQSQSQSQSQMQKSGQQKFYDVKGNEISKIQAIRTMIIEPGAVVRRCVELELSTDAKVRIKK